MKIKDEMVDAEARVQSLRRKIKVLNQGREYLARLAKELEEDAAQLSTQEQAALEVLAGWRDLHTAEVEFSLGDSAAKELGTERVVRDGIPLNEANAIGSYITGSAEVVEVTPDPWDDRTIEAKLDKRDGKHRVLLDLDCPHVYVPSSTPGHGHLLIDVPQDFNTMLALLNMLFEMGILQSGFAAATKHRGETWLRAPGVLKTTETDAL